MHSQILKMPNCLKGLLGDTELGHSPNTPFAASSQALPSGNAAFLPVEFILPWISPQSV